MRVITKDEPLPLRKRWVVRCMEHDEEVDWYYKSVRELVAYNSLAERSETGCSQCQQLPPGERFSVELSVRCEEPCGAEKWIPISGAIEKAHAALRGVLLDSPEFDGFRVFRYHEQVPRLPSKAGLLCRDLKPYALGGKGKDQDFRLRVLEAMKVDFRDWQSKHSLRAKLQEKQRQAEANGWPTEMTYIRIRIIDPPQLNHQSAILEFWPFEHKSPIHMHGGCAGAILVLAGQLHVTNWRHWQAVQDGLTAQQAPELVHEADLVAGDVTWMDRQNYCIHQVECTEDPSDLGFALSIHTYMSCEKEFKFLKEGTLHERAPASDYIWYVGGVQVKQDYLQRLPAEDAAAAQQIPDFERLVLATRGVV